MKWKKEAFGLGHSKKKNGSAKDKKSPGSSSKRSNSLRDGAAVESPAPTTPRAPKSNGPGLGTVRVGIIRSESAPICTPTPLAKRQLVSDLLAMDGGEGDEHEHEPNAASPALRGVISNKSTLGKSFDREVGNGDAFSSYNREEKVAFARHLNRYLLGDPFLAHLLPLDSGGGDFLSKFHDGVLMCRLVCLAIPGSVADSKINVPVGAEPLGLYKATENLNAALKAAESAGLQVVNIGAADIIEGRPASILGLSWQLIRVHLLAQINLKGCPDLIHLMEEGEVKEDFYQLPAEEILLRWFNHHLRWGGSERRVSNFGEDLSDGRCYITLMKELNDNFKGDESDWADEDTKRDSQFRRACLVISAAEGIGLAPLIRPCHIKAKAQLFNIAFVAQLLNRRPRIHRESLHLDASVAMQAWYRMVTVMRHTTPLIRRRRRSASTLNRASRRWMHGRQRNRAATTLQAWQRGRMGRVTASARRFEVALAASVKMEEQQAKAAFEASKKAALEASRLEAVRLEERARELREQEAATAAAAERARELREREEQEAAAATAAERATELREREEHKAAAAAAERARELREREEQQAAAAAAAAAAERARELREREEQEASAAAAAERARELHEQEEQEAAAAAAAAERARELREQEEYEAAAASAANTVHNWSRDNRESRMASLSPERQRQESLEMNMKDSPMPQNLSPRTSAASSLRVSEDSPIAGTAPSSFPGEEADAPDKSVSWFDKVFKGISFTRDPSRNVDTSRVSKTTRRQEAAAAMVIQRWQRAHAGTKTERVRAKQEANDRRWAVGALHKAYSIKWRFEIAARKEARQKQKQQEEEEEEARRRAESNSKKGRLGGLWAELVRHVSWRSELSGKSKRGRLEVEKADDEADCCDDKGKDVLASEVEAWKLPYFTKQVLGFSQPANAQEARARLHSKLGADDRSWTPPEESLTPGKVVAIMSVVLSVVYETALANAAAVGG